MSFIDNIQANPSPFLMELIARKGGMSHMPMPWSYSFE